MDWLTFFSSVIKSLAWPLAVIVAVVILRRPLKDLLPFLQKLKYKDFEAEFGKRVEEVHLEVEQELPMTAEPTSLREPSKSLVARLAEVSPRSAVLEAWLDVEKAAIEAVVHLGGTDFRRQGLSFDAIRFLENQKNLDPGVVSLIRDLRGLRNEAAHVPEFALTTQSALQYIASAEGVANYLRQIVK